MDQWFDSHLVAIQFMSNTGAYKVIELPPARTSAHTHRLEFGTIDEAEQFIDDQFPESLTVAYEDIKEEIDRRKKIIANEAD